MRPASTAAVASWRGDGRLGPRTQTPLLRSGKSRSITAWGVGDGVAGSAIDGAAAGDAGDDAPLWGCGSSEACGEGVCVAASPAERCALAACPMVAESASSAAMVTL